MSDVSTDWETSARFLQEQLEDHLGHEQPGDLSEPDPDDE